MIDPREQWWSRDGVLWRRLETASQVRVEIDAIGDLRFVRSRGLEAILKGRRL